MKTFLERFRDSYEIDKKTGCWNWTGSKNGINGYGRITVEGKSYCAHRVSYELFVGIIPNGYNVCHKCDNPVCINPDHLFVGTRSDNMQDASNKGRIKQVANIDKKIELAESGNKVPINARLDKISLLAIKKLMEEHNCSLTKVIEKAIVSFSKKSDQGP